MPVASLVLGILGLLLAFIPMVGLVGLLLGIAGMVLGIIARKKLVQQGQPSGLATAGMVLGIIAIGLSVLITGSCMYCSGKLSQEIEKQAEQQKNDPQLKKELNDFEKALEENKAK